MTHARKLRALLPLAAVAVALLAARTDRAQACCLADWFGWSRPTTVTAGYYYVPTTSYRTLYTPVAVTSYVPAPCGAPACGACGACGTCGAAATTAYMPVTSYVQKPVLQAYTSYRLVSAPIVAPACSACATAYYPPACGTCGCSSCGCRSCGCAAGACPTCGCASGACGAGGCATCGYAPPACSACGAGVAAAPIYSTSAYPATTIAPPANYTASTALLPITTTPYLPTVGAAPAITGAPVYSAPIASPPVTATYPPAPYVVPAPSMAPGTSTPTYGMPLSPSLPPAGIIAQPGVPTLAPPAPGKSSADIAPSLPGPVPPPPAGQQPQNSASPQIPESPNGSQEKTLETPSTPGSTTPGTAPAKPIPDIRAPGTPGSSRSQRPLDPNSRTAYSMPMMRPGMHYSTPWPIAKTTAALMPIVPAVSEASSAAPHPLSADDADGWHAVR